MGSECNTSSYNYDSSPVLGTTHQIVWQGGTFTCNGEVLVCNGTRLTTMQATILEKVCSLITATNVCDIVLPTCFSTFFGTVGCADSDKTVIDFINLLLDTACQQQAQIDGLPTTNNPIVSLNYCCCNNGECNTSVQLTLSEHIQKILDCLCDLKLQVTQLQTSLENYATKEEVQVLSDKLTCVMGKLVLEGINLTGC